MHHKEAIADASQTELSITDIASAPNTASGIFRSEYASEIIRLNQSGAERTIRRMIELRIGSATETRRSKLLFTGAASDRGQWIFFFLKKIVEESDIVPARGMTPGDSRYENTWG